MTKITSSELNDFFPKSLYIRVKDAKANSGDPDEMAGKDSARLALSCKQIQPFSLFASFYGLKSVSTR